jgi:hypothetical protein
MATKQFKIGERAVGGIIKVDVTGKAVSLIRIECLDWNSKKVVQSGTATTDDPDAYRKVDVFLNEITSSYHADKVMEWLKSKASFKKESWF